VAPDHVRRIEEGEPALASLTPAWLGRMHNPPLILIADDNEINRDILRTRLRSQGYELLEAEDGQQALSIASQHHPDLILLDVMMPKMNGVEVCRRLKSDADLPFIPIVLVTAKVDSKDVVAGLEAGADEYLTKPVDQAALVARVKSMLRMKELTDQVRAQAADLASWNRTLEDRVARQLKQIERMNRLRRFLSPQVAELILSSEDDRLLDSHRRDVTVLFCDLRGFTAFSETAEPEEVMNILSEYYAGVGVIIHKYQGTIEHFAGDGLMAILNDPLPCPDPCVQAVRMAVEMRTAVGDLTAKWHKHGFDLGFGVGIAHGYATLGRIGFEGRFDYAAIGTVTNLASRLCDEAKDGQILVDGKICVAVEQVAELETVQELKLKGFQRPISAANVRAISA
jgi:adenylate cyclase